MALASAYWSGVMSVFRGFDWVACSSQTSRARAPSRTTVAIAEVPAQVLRRSFSCIFGFCFASIRAQFLVDRSRICDRRLRLGRRSITGPVDRHLLRVVDTHPTGPVDPVRDFLLPAVSAADATICA